MSTDDHYEPTAEEYAVLAAATDRAERHAASPSRTRRIWRDTTSADVERAIREDVHRDRAHHPGESVDDWIRRTTPRPPAA